MKRVTVSQSREQHCLLMVPELDQVLFILQLQPDCFCFVLREFGFQLNCLQDSKGSCLVKRFRAASCHLQTMWARPRRSGLILGVPACKADIITFSKTSSCALLSRESSLASSMHAQPFIKRVCWTPLGAPGARGARSCQRVALCQLLCA